MLSPVYALVLNLMLGADEMSANMGQFAYEYGSLSVCQEAEKMMKKTSINWARFDSECIATGKFAELQQKDFKQIMLVQGFVLGDKLQQKPFIQVWENSISACQRTMGFVRKQVENKPNYNVALACIPSIER
ncbi:hypothetical protein ABQ431_05455 [Serratia fonticola]|uniref:hypothetical protein n=1 Tax=Serratia fonticola TaxID=47917 RepID=UPI003AB0E690